MTEEEDEPKPKPFEFTRRSRRHDRGIELEIQAIDRPDCVGHPSDAHCFPATTGGRWGRAQRGQLMSKKREHVISIGGRRVVVGDVRDIDLDEEVVLDDAGNRLTESVADAIAQEALRRFRGRPSLSEPGERSPQVSFRVSIDLRDRAEARAAKEDKTLSELARDALEHYLATG